MFADPTAIGYLHLVCGLIAAKWAMDLGFSQPRQLLWAVAAVVAAPVVLLVLYVRLQYQAAGVAARPAIA